MDGTTVVTQVQEKPAFPAGKNVADLIHKYVRLRDKVKEIKDVHKTQLEPYVQMMAQLEGMLLGVLHDANVDSMKSDAGTAFKSTETSVTVGDWNEAFKHIQDNGLWDLVEARVNKTAALAIVEETGKPIPGVKISQSEVLRVRRS